MGLDVFILEITSLACIAALLCAVPVTILRRPRLLRRCGVTVAALSGLVVAEVIVAAVLGHGTRATVTAQAAPATVIPSSVPTISAPPATSAPVPAPRPDAADAAQRAPAPKATPTPFRRPPDTDASRAFRSYWSEVVRVSAVALRAHDKAGEFLRSGNDVGAVLELDKCRDTARRIRSRPPDRPLDEKSDLDRQLSAAIAKVGAGLHDGCTSARSYLNTNAAADFDTAQTHFAGVPDALFRSETLARSEYARLGGNPDTLPSFKEALR